MKTLLLSLALPVSLLAAPTAAAPPATRAVSAAPVRISKASIDRALADMVRSGRVVGASALIWQNGREAYVGTAGQADREAARPMTRDTLAQIYSMTKPVTGVALMTLWEQGRFGLDDPLSRYLPEFAGVQVADGADTAGRPVLRAPTRPILVRDILRHTAGFGYGSGTDAVGTAWAQLDPLGTDHDLAEFGRRLARVPLLHDPGARWSYSAAVDVQALLVEKLTGVPFEQFVRERIFEPLGMRETAWTQPESRYPRLAAMYERPGGSTLTRASEREQRGLNFDPARRLTMGGAGLVSSLDDYMRFARMLLNEGALGDVRILKPSTVRLMATDALDPRITERSWLGSKGSGGFGMDFFVRTAQPKTAAENRGAIGEFFWDGRASTLFWVDPVNGIAAVFLVQVIPFDATLHRDLRRAVYGDDYLGPVGD
ncbi:CubicO group peptidase, beta-lactamase class C family [Sphingomonas guangdongensis]|uniref:CubicO group peptidase, beta-lactamase class C family n=1 Tax=Sphingomonas guangdongensis TaxID=1141890 RepID=A0A285QX62_9SPHN|nr:serine hydrolase domain-containing protein [Sphingomonas guangdongensis]SOB86416.1 CubicO group peptidase, beta-lactamase class C family [Sphingomonas guangdongensis]